MIESQWRQTRIVIDLSVAEDPGVAVDLSGVGDLGGVGDPAPTVRMTVGGDWTGPEVEGGWFVHRQRTQ